jgi:hypothetical protein
MKRLVPHRRNCLGPRASCKHALASAVPPVHGPPQQSGLHGVSRRKKGGVAWRYRNVLVGNQKRARACRAGGGRARAAPAATTAARVPRRWQLRPRACRAGGNYGRARAAPAAGRDGAGPPCWRVFSLLFSRARSLSFSRARAGLQLHNARDGLDLRW